MAYFEIQGLNKRFDENVVLNDINMAVAEGEFFVLLGPSGGGKSTLLRIICGIETPDSGEIMLAGRSIVRLPSRERNIGMVFQDYGLYPNMNVRQNIAYGLEARNTPKEIVEKRVKSAAERLGLGTFLERSILDMSGGEQQRVALARALAKEAELYLFDEPLSNLDPKLRVQARRDILMVHREKRKPTLYVTHDQTEALASGDRIGIVAQGRLQQVGTADDLIQRPANMFVAKFVGMPSMNLIDGAIGFDTEADRFMVRIAGQNVLNLPPRWNLALGSYRQPRVVIGIPPGAFYPETDTHPHEHCGSLEAEIRGVEALVGEVIVTLKPFNGEQPFAALFQGMDEEAFRLGDFLKIGIDGEHLCLFDPNTTQALSPA